MRFIVNRESFLKSILVADTVVRNVKSPLAILLNVYIEVFSDNSILIMSYNGENGVRLEIEGSVEEPGKITLFSKKLLESLRKISAEKVMIRTSEESETQVFIHPANSNIPIFDLNGIPAEAYPVFYEFNWETYFTLSSETFKELVDYTIFAVSQDTAKPAFTGVYLEEPVEGMLSFVASDGKRLAFLTRNYIDKKGEIALNVIIPENVLRTAIAAIDNDGDVNFSVSQNQAFLRFGNTYIFSNLIDGKFPNYKDVIPKNKLNFGIIGGKPFQEALEVVSVMADPETKRIKLEIKEGKMIISSQHPVYGEAREELELLEYEGSEIFVYANYKHLLDFLNVAGERNVDFTINSQGSPMVFRIVGEENYTYIDMPLRSYEE